MTAPYRRNDGVDVLGNHERRIGVLEAVAPPVSVSGTTLHHEMFFGPLLERYVSSSYNDAYSNVVYDSAAPFGAYATSFGQADLEGWYFPLGPLQPRTGYALDLHLEQGSDKGNILIEYATTPINEFPVNGFGSDVSIISPYSMDVWDPGSFSGWWNTGDLGVIGDKIDMYNAVTAWKFVINRGRFWTAGANGTMLTADGLPPTDPANQLWSESGKFDAGGDPTVAWWVRFRADGKRAASTGYGQKFAGFDFYRQSGDGSYV